MRGKNNLILTKCKISIRKKRKTALPPFIFKKSQIECWASKKNGLIIDRILTQGMVENNLGSDCLTHPMDLYPNHFKEPTLRLQAFFLEILTVSDFSVHGACYRFWARAFLLPSTHTINIAPPILNMSEMKPTHTF